ncbi:MAG: LCP family protein [Patescibacteria group bacterium]
MSLHPKVKPKARTSDNVVVTTQATPERLGCRRWIRRWIIRLILIIISILILFGIGFYVTQPRYYHILVIGSDQRTNERARSDALMILSIPKSKADPMSLMMVPRDTKIEDPDYGLQKITHFYAMWDDNTERMGNAALTTAQVEKLLGITMNGTVEITFDSFTEIVDSVGGVDISTGHVDGTEAQELVHNRFVQAEGDFGRAAEQREVFQAVLKKAKNPLVAQRLYNYLSSSDRSRLNLSQSSLMSFGIAYLIGHRSFSLPKMEEVVLPGEGQRIYTPSFGKSLYYWVLDEAGTKDLVNKYLR